MDYESDELVTDDEYGRGGLPAHIDTSTGYASSPVDANATPTSRTASNQNTPKTSRYTGEDVAPELSPPRERVDLWNARQCAEFVASLGGAFQTYAHNMIAEGIIGDVFVTMLHDDLKELGVDSMGHRLTILKAIYEVKIRHRVPIEADQFVPLSVGVNAAAHGRITQEDINAILYQIKSRDGRILAAESELRTMKCHLDRVFEDTKRLREDMLPVARAVKNSQPLPPAPDAAMTIPTITSTTHPDGPIHSAPLHSISIHSTRAHAATMHSAPIYPPPNKPPPGPPPMPHMIDIKPQSEGLSRSLSRKLSNKRFPFGASAKVPSPTTIRETPALEAYATSNPTHLSPATFGQSQQPSPTSPSYSINPASTISSSRRGNPPSESWAESYASSLASDPRLTTHSYTPSALAPPPRRAPQPAPSTATLNTTLLHHDHANSAATITDPSTVQNFKVSDSETTVQVLPLAMRKWRINGDPRDYNLYIVCGNNERLLEPWERPLELFKTFQKRKENPMFMLRRLGGGPAIGGPSGGVLGGRVAGKLVPGGGF